MVTAELAAMESAAGPVSLQLRPASDRAAILRDWRRLERERHNDRLACSADWTECWLEHYGDLVPHRFVVAQQGDSLAGLALLTQGVNQTDGPFPVATLHLGTAGEPPAESVVLEYNALLTTPACRSEFLHQLLLLVADDSDWEEFRLDGFEETDLRELMSSVRPIGDEADSREQRAESQAKDVTEQHLTLNSQYSVLRAQSARRADAAPLVTERSSSSGSPLSALRSPLSPSTELRSEVSRYCDLKTARDAGTDALSQLGYATRKVIRKNLKAYGELQTEWAEEVAHAEAIYDDLVQLHQARWNAVGQPGVYASERFRGFHRDLIGCLLPQSRVGLFRVRQGRETIGCIHLYIDRNRALVYQGGSAAYEGKLSPGLVVDYLCMEECLRRGLDAYDFLAGDSLHKQRLTNAANTLMWAAHRHRGHFKHAVADSLRSVKATLRSAFGGRG